MASKYQATDGNDTFTLSGAPDTILAGAGSDTFIINSPAIRHFTLDGGTNANGDAVVNPIYFTGTSLSTVKTTLGTPHATDTIKINTSGNFTALAFTHIERIDLAEGVTATFSSNQLVNAIDSLGDNGDNATGLNPGLHFYGTAGGKIETAKVLVDYKGTTFTPASTMIGAKPITYSIGDFQLDDASMGDLFHNVQYSVDFGLRSSSKSYARGDGSNNNDYGIGSKGVDYFTGRLGNDTYLGGPGNDLLVGHQGADSLDGGTGNDVFLITSFGGTLGAAGKADDGNPEWVAGDVIIGGPGTDTLRITGGAAAPTVVSLTDLNFQSMEKVEIGAAVGKLNVEDTALQLLNNHYYLNTAGTIIGKDLRAGQTADNVIVDASAMKANGLTFEGNANNNTFIGTQKDDTFIGNGGNDTLTGGGGADKFVFGQVHTQTVSGDATSIQTYKDVASNLSGVDTITDFKSGTDTLVLKTDMFTAFAASKSATLGDALKFNPTSHTLSYNGVDFVVLTGVANLSANDISVV